MRSTLERIVTHFENKWPAVPFLTPATPDALLRLKSVDCLLGPPNNPLFSSVTGTAFSLATDFLRQSEVEPLLLEAGVVDASVAGFLAKKGDLSLELVLGAGGVSTTSELLTRVEELRKRGMVGKTVGRQGGGGRVEHVKEVA